MKKISIVIITYNRVADTLDLLDDIVTLDDLHLLADVVLVNNASSDDYAVIKSFINWHKEVPFKYIDAPENLGVSRGRNYAVQFAAGDIMLFIDDDVNLKDKDSLSKIVEVFAEETIEGRKLGAASFRVLHTSNMQMQVNALPHKQFQKYKDKQSFLTYYYAGCAHAKLKLAWNETGPYPENFFYGMEEYDFSFRLVDKGYCIKYDASITILHKESPLGRTTKAEKLKMMWVNKSKVAWRYLPKKYFYTTAFLWSFEYLRKTSFNLKYFSSAWKEIIQIPSTEKRNPIGQSALDYLQKVEARLLY